MQRQELVAASALAVLEECGFSTNRDWHTLARNLGLPKDKRDQLKQQLDKYGAADALEEALDYYIRNNENASWESLIKAVKQMDKKVASKLKNFLQADGVAVGEHEAQSVMCVKTKLVVQQQSAAVLPAQPVEIVIDMNDKSPSESEKTTATGQIAEMSLLLTMFVLELHCWGSVWIVCFYLTVRVLFAMTCELASLFVHLKDPPTKRQTIIPASKVTINYHLNEGISSSPPCSSTATVADTPALVSPLYSSVYPLKIRDYEKYQLFTEKLRTLVLEGATDVEIRRHARPSSLSVDFDDESVLVCIFLGFHYQKSSKFTPMECHAKSKEELRKAIDICNEGNCANRKFLLARIYTFKAQTYFMADKMMQARDCADKAEMYFSQLQTKHEKCGLIYQRAMQEMQCELEGNHGITDERLTKVEDLMNRAIELASIDSSYQAQSLTFFMLVKKAMLYLSVFNFTHPRFRDTSPEISQSHLDKACDCLSMARQVHPAFISSEKPSFYKAFYFFAMSECYRHIGDYVSSLQHLENAERQFNLSKRLFPKERLENRKAVLRKQLNR